MKTENLNDQPDTITLSEIVEPLAQALQTLTQHPVDGIKVVRSTFEGQQNRSHETHIALNLYAETPDQLLQALWSILEQTGSWDRWLNFAGPDEDNPYYGPIMFALMQQHYGSGHLEYDRYLWCYCRDEDFDVGAAKRQIANLVALISNINNLVQLTPQHRMWL